METQKNGCAGCTAGKVGMNNQYRKFEPDLIVEATRLCDRNCPGCYAPNFISQGLPLELYDQKPELFLQPITFEKLLQREDLKQVRSIAFRGGEPSKHPFLYSLIQSAHKVAKEVYIETHGRWILNPLGYFGLMVESEKNGTIFKLSYDRMHGLSSQDLYEITQALDKKNINWVVAVTEFTEGTFAKTRSKIQWIPDEKIIYQKKAQFQSDLIKPQLGVVKVNGTIADDLTVKAAFKAVQTVFEASP